MSETVFQLPNGRQQFEGALGPLVGGSVYHYIPGTTTFKATWQDPGATILNTNPIILDGIGSAAIWGNGAYRQVVFDSLGNQVWDQVTSIPAISTGVLVTQFATIQLADAAANAANAPLVFPQGIAVLSANYTFLSSLQFLQGGAMSVSAGFTATITKPIDASPDYQIFTGAGSVVGIRQVYPEWWGARVGGIDCLAAFNSAYACVAASAPSVGGRQKITFQGGVYVLSGPWVTPVGASISLHFEGAGVSLGGTRFEPRTGFVGTKLWWVRGSTDSTQQIADWKITDIGLDMTPGGAGPSLYGLMIGSDPVSPTSGELLLGLEPNLIENLWIQGFPTNLSICAATLIVFRRCGLWNQIQTGACLNLLISVNNNVTADVTFTDGTQFVAPIGVAGANNINLKANLHQFAFPPVQNQLAGIKFDRCDFYQGDTSVALTCGAGAELTDVWFIACQWDGSSKKLIDIECDSVPSIIQDIHVVDCYLDGANLTSGTAAITVASTGTGGFIRNVWIDGNWFANGVGPGVLLFSLQQTVRGISCDNNMFENYNYTTGSVIEVGGVKTGSFNNNKMTRTDGGSQVTLYMIDIQAAGGPSLGNDYITCTLNIAGGLATGGVVNDISGGIHKFVDNNI